MEAEPHQFTILLKKQVSTFQVHPKHDGFSVPGVIAVRVSATRAAHPRSAHGCAHCGYARTPTGAQVRWKGRQL